MKIEVRQATLADVDAIRYLFRDSVLSVNSKDYSQDEVIVWADHYKNTDNWIKKINDQHFLVAQIEKKIVGFSSITDNGYLDFMYVHKDFQRQGVAIKLLHEIELQADKLSIKLITTHSSKTAKPFFEKHGYIKTGDHLNKVNSIDFINSVMVKSK